MGTAFYKVATLYVDVIFAYLGNTPTKRKVTYAKAARPGQLRKQPVTAPGPLVLRFVPYRFTLPFATTHGFSERGVVFESSPNHPDRMICTGYFKITAASVAPNWNRILPL